MVQSTSSAARDLPRRFYGRRERLRECLIAAGAENLPDYELLEIMLFTSHPRGDMDGLVEKLLDHFGTLAEVLSADVEALAAAGLMKPAVAGIKFVREVALRFFRAELHERPVVGSWDKLMVYCNAQFSYSKVEEFHVLFLDRKNALIKVECQQRGTVDYTPVYTREVVKRALELGASALILVHNHPSGDPTPSEADINTTNNIIKAAAIFGITLHDHLIIGRGQYASLRDLGFIQTKQTHDFLTICESELLELQDSDHFRALSSKLRDVARLCRFPGARKELLNLAARYERRADALCDKSPK